MSDLEKLEKIHNDMKNVSKEIEEIENSKREISEEVKKQELREALEKSARVIRYGW